MTNMPFIRLALLAALLTACRGEPSYRVCIYEGYTPSTCFRVVQIPLKGKALAYNGTLQAVGVTRQTKKVDVPIADTVDVEGFQCRIGVPYGHAELIGKTVIFMSEDGLSAPWLVTDVEQVKHAGIMDGNNILADVDCERYVHATGILLIIEE